MQYSFVVENIRCGGCKNTIASKLTKMVQVKEVHVDIDEKKITVVTTPDNDPNMRNILGQKLAKLGYPEVGTTDSNSLLTKAASVVSCAIGKVSNKE